MIIDGFTKSDHTCFVGLLYPAEGIWPHLDDGKIFYMVRYPKAQIEYAKSANHVLAEMIYWNPKPSRFSLPNRRSDSMYRYEPGGNLWLNESTME